VNRKALKDEAAAVRAILHGEWDPIGCGVPEDEYDTYLWPVLELLKRGAPRAEVKAYLAEAARGMLSPVPESRLSRVADMLMKLDVERSR
jgi:hypothetical protein